MSPTVNLCFAVSVDIHFGKSNECYSYDTNDIQFVGEKEIKSCNFADNVAFFHLSISNFLVVE